jgi:hypothetical protein
MQWECVHCVSREFTSVEAGETRQYPGLRGSVSTVVPLSGQLVPTWHCWQSGWSALVINELSK